MERAKAAVAAAKKRLRNAESRAKSVREAPILTPGRDACARLPA